MGILIREYLYKNITIDNICSFIKDKIYNANIYNNLIYVTDMAFDIASLKYDILNGIRHVYELKGENGSIAKIILRYNQNEFSFNVDYVELKKDFTMEDKEEIKIFFQFILEKLKSDIVGYIDEKYNVELTITFLEKDKKSIKFIENIGFKQVGLLVNEIPEGNLKCYVLQY